MSKNESSNDLTKTWKQTAVRQIESNRNKGNIKFLAAVEGL